MATFDLYDQSGIVRSEAPGEEGLTAMIANHLEDTETWLIASAPELIEGRKFRFIIQDEPV